MKVKSTNSPMQDFQFHSKTGNRKIPSYLALSSPVQLLITLAPQTISSCLGYNCRGPLLASRWGFLHTPGSLTPLRLADSFSLLDSLRCPWAWNLSKMDCCPLSRSPLSQDRITYLSLEGSAPPFWMKP